MRRSLSLKRETLVELSTDELGSVYGAEAYPTSEGRCPTLPLDCIQDLTAALFQNTFICIPHTVTCR